MGAPNKVFDLSNESKEIYQEIIVYDYHGNKNQKWTIVDLGDGNIQIMSILSGMVL